MAHIKCTGLRGASWFDLTVQDGTVVTIGVDDDGEGERRAMIRIGRLIWGAGLPRKEHVFDCTGVKPDLYPPFRSEAFNLIDALLERKKYEQTLPVPHGTIFLCVTREDDGSDIENLACAVRIELRAAATGGDRTEKLEVP